MATDLIASREVIAERLEELKNALIGLVDYLVSTDPAHIDRYVGKLRTQNPSMSRDQLAKLVVSRKAVKQGLVGAIGGLGGVLSLPISVPAELVASWKIQVNMAMAIARVYGHDTSAPEFKTDVYLIMAGDRARESLKQLGLDVGEKLTRRALEKLLTDEIRLQIRSAIPKAIIRKTGRSTSSKLMKLVPVASAPVNFAFDYGAAKVIGNTAIRYYSARAESEEDS